MDSAVNPLLTIETIQETKVQEITYDGQEIPQPPLLMSENLAKLASRIDWCIEAAGETDPVSTPAIDSTEQTAVTTGSATGDQTEPASSWPWAGVRDKIRSAYTELCVLSDTLSIARHKRYMVLDAVTQDAPEPRLLVQVIAKKKALQGAVQILAEGAERMRENLVEQKRSRAIGDFYTELQRLRHGWRVRKLGNNIVGSLSYRHVGSQFWLPGTFDVKKCDTAATPSSAAVHGCSPAAGGATQQSPAALVACPLAVVIPSELQGSACISVRITGDGSDSVARRSSAIEARASLLPSGASSGHSAKHWRQQLEAAQNVLFCRELIAQLACEAVEADSGRPHLVVANKITSQLFDDVMMTIELVHTPTTSQSDRTSEEELCGDRQSSESVTVNDSPTATTNSSDSCGASDTVLAHSLHQMLRQMHYNNMYKAPPHPASAPLGPCKRRRMAGPAALSRANLVKLIESETILERIVRQARHTVLRQRTAQLLERWCVGSTMVDGDPLALTSSSGDDPLLTCHWLPVNSPEQSCCKVNWASHGYDSVQRTSLLINVHPDGLRCITREGQVINLGHDPAELQHTLLSQVVQHNLSACQHLARMLGWTVISSSSSWTPSSGGVAADVENSCSCQLLSAAGDSRVLVKCWHEQVAVHVSVSVSQLVKNGYSDSQCDRLLVRDSWKQLNHSKPRQVDWERMAGRNFLNKLELLLANVTSEPPTST